jgi:hypothetical protein
MKCHLFSWPGVSHLTSAVGFAASRAWLFGKRPRGESGRRVPFRPAALAPESRWTPSAIFAAQQSFAAGSEAFSPPAPRPC